MLNQTVPINEIDWSVFPPYLCYGQIDESSKRIVDNCLVVDYLMNNKKVHEVRINENYAEIQDFWEGEYLDISHHPNLKNSVLSHYNFVNQLQSPIHKYWVHDLIKNGNIYVEYIDVNKVDLLTFPDVFLIDLYIPVRKSEDLLVDKITTVPSLIFFDFKISESTLTWKNREDEKIIQENIILIQIVIPIAFVYDVFDQIKEYIHKEKIMRAFTQVHIKRNGYSIKLFYGNKNDIFSNYSILINNDINEK